MRYEVRAAEALATVEGLSEGSVNVLTAAMAVSLLLNVSKLPTAPELGLTIETRCLGSLVDLAEF